MGNEVNRTVMYRMYPSASQEAAMLRMLGLHQRLYNAALQQRIWAWKFHRKLLSFNAQCKELTQLRREDPDYAAVNAQSLQVTLTRLDRAYGAFFRRFRQGAQAVGFPRFKSFDRYSGWGYKAHGDGWKLMVEGRKHGSIRLTGIGNVRIRGQARTPGVPMTCAVLRKGGHWYVAIAVACQPTRASGMDACGIDLGVETFVTIARQDGRIDVIQNPRFLRNKLPDLKRAHRKFARRKKGSKRRELAKKELARAHRKIAAKRDDFLHQASATLVRCYGLIATEALDIRAMTAPGAAYKKGLNRELLNASFGLFSARLRYKAEEAGIVFVELPTKKLKPSQTCSACGEQRKKPLAERLHICACGLRLGRDANAARVLLNVALFKAPTGREPSGRGGTG